MKIKINFYEYKEYVDANIIKIVKRKDDLVPFPPPVSGNEK
jgi:hypothetical protein